MIQLNLLKNDIRFQFRHGFYYAYLVITIFYIGILRFIPLDFKEYIATLIIFSDPSALGGFFIGGIILLEKNQRIFDGLFSAPVRIQDYLFAKVFSLAIISLLTSFIVVFASGLKVNILLLFIGVIMSAVFFTLIGLSLAVIVKNLNQYILLSPLYTFFFVLPILDYLEIYYHPVFMLLPANASLILIEGAFWGISLGSFIYSVVNLGVWIMVAYVLSRVWFYKYIILNLGGGGR
ncbi:ABC transporter permease [Natranaerofaba carboxydovora]|uniref:fluoroquinolone export ABC transporter permease subunit n=1 Tax=Natranaerofaba carboxydovora TaxID=2742683 RepID=UPI001F146422|nr:ABC transporter permease [Natranaerofaba carboxydovora]UMZ73042.1 Fluoroquinolones export permease protein [Natranaerofaba carboxydovora]